MKHIGIVVPNFPVASETFVATEIQGLVEAGHKVSVFCFNYDATLQHRVPGGVEVVDLTLSADINFRALPSQVLAAFPTAVKLCFQQKHASRKSLLRYAARLGQEAFVRGCQHLHSHFLGISLSHAVVAGALFKIPVSCVGHGHDVYQTPTDLSVKLSRCEFAVAVCEDMKQRLGGLTQSPIHVIHCGVNTDKFSVHQAPKNSTTRLFFIGRLVEKKGLVYALEAIASIPPRQRPTLDIIGDGPDRKWLETLTKRLDIQANVNFLGFKTPDWLQQQTADYDALIAPFCEAQNGDRDTGPVVLKEAMAMGIPVITTRFMGCAEIVDPHSGWLVETQCSYQLADAVQQLSALTNDETQAMRAAARKRVESHFCAIKQAKKLSDHIQEVPHHVCD